ncbi:TPA: DNA mismatch repair protein MutS [Legionella pneumophila]
MKKMAKEYYLSDEIEEIVLASTVLSYSRPNLSSKRFNDLKNGKTPWEAELDLNGLNVESARKNLYQFIQTQIKNNKQCVLIIHGADNSQDKPPLMKNLVNRWLPQINEVLAFHSAKPKDGGSAAVYVLLGSVFHVELPTRLPSNRSESTFLVAETKAMERRRRLAEQQGERRFASVKAREHPEEEIKAAPEGELQNNILQHPELNSQRFDGIDPNLNPEPPLNTEARREFDNERREQDKEKQLRLGNMPKFTTAPTPRGP